MNVYRTYAVVTNVSSMNFPMHICVEYQTQPLFFSSRKNAASPKSIHYFEQLSKINKLHQSFSYEFFFFFIFKWRRRNLYFRAKLFEIMVANEVYKFPIRKYFEYLWDFLANNVLQIMFSEGIFVLNGSDEKDGKYYSNVEKYGVYVFNEISFICGKIVAYGVAAKVPQEHRSQTRCFSCFI